MLHKDDQQTFDEAERLAHRLAAHIGERIKVFEAKRRPCTGTEGLCYVDERRISILFRHKQCADAGGAWANNPIPKERVLKTVAHEVAHLKHRNHGAEFTQLESELIALI